MLIPKIKVVYYKRNFKKTSKRYEDSFDITDLIDTSNNQGIAVRKDTFNIKVPNYKLRTNENFYSIIRNYNQQKNKSSFSVEDRIEIFAWYGAEPTDSSHRIMNGLVADFSYSLDNKGGTYTIGGVNTTEVLLRMTVPAIKYGNKGDSYVEVPHIIIDLIKEGNKFNRDAPERQVFAGIGRLKTDGSGELTENSKKLNRYVYPSQRDGTPFPLTSYVSKYDPIYVHIEKLSTLEYTDDETGAYIFFIDANNIFHWEPKTRAISGIFKEEDFITWKLTKDTFDIINTVIVHAGVTPGRRGVTALAYNTTSQGQFGAKWKFIPTKIITDMLDNEKADGPDSNGGTEIAYDGFPASYPWKMQIQEIAENDDGSLIELGNLWTVADDDEFEEAVRKYGKKYAKDRGLAVVDKLGGATYKLTATLGEGSNDYTLGTLFNIASRSIGIESDPDSITEQVNEIKLRLTQVAHSFGKTGWQTTLTLEEDEVVFIEGKSDL